MNNSWNLTTLLPTMPTVRYNVRGIAMQDALYLVGGHDNSGTLATVEKFNVTSQQWSRMAPMASPREGFACVKVES